MVILYKHDSDSNDIQSQEIDDTRGYNDDNKERSNLTNVKTLSENLSQTTSVLCPSYKIDRIKNGTLTCLAIFPPNTCNTTVDIYLEVWITENKLLQSSPKQLLIDCDPDVQLR